MATVGRVDQHAGERFGKYAIVRRVGVGGMGDVYEGRHVELEKRVAIKTLRRDRAGDPEARARFHREGTAAARVRHPHAVEVFDVGEADGTPYLVMEFLEGEDLAAWLAREGPRPPAEIADVMLPVLAAVAAAHDEGVLHRDLKPANVFLARTRDGEVLPKVVDFGVSSIASVQQLGAITHSHAIVGTPAYMSPEQTQGMRDLTAASDQYALGVIAYECATGRLPVEPGPVLGMLLRIGQGQFAPPRAVRPELPVEFERVILRAMALDPAQRFASVRELGRALLPFAGERAVPSGGARALGARVPIALAAVIGGAALAWAVVPRGGAGRARGSYEVALEAQPATARFELDGVAVGVGALRRAFVADGAQHVVTVSAPGYAPQEVVFVDAPPTSARVVLTPRAVAPVVAAPTVVAPTVVAPVVAVPAVTARPLERGRGVRREPRVRPAGMVLPSVNAPPAPRVGTNNIGVL